MKKPTRQMTAGKRRARRAFLKGQLLTLPESGWRPGKRVPLAKLEELYAAATGRTPERGQDESSPA